MAALPLPQQQDRAANLHKNQLSEPAGGCPWKKDPQHSGEAALPMQSPIGCTGLTGD